MSKTTLSDIHKGSAIVRIDGWLVGWVVRDGSYGMWAAHTFFGHAGEGYTRRHAVRRTVEQHNRIMGGQIA